MDWTIISRITRTSSRYSWNCMNATKSFDNSSKSLRSSLRSNALLILDGMSAIPSPTSRRLVFETRGRKPCCADIPRKLWLNRTNRRQNCKQSPQNLTVCVDLKTILVQLNRPEVENKLPSSTKVPVDRIAEILLDPIKRKWQICNLTINRSLAFTIRWFFLCRHRVEQY